MYVTDTSVLIDIYIFLLLLRVLPLPFLFQLPKAAFGANPRAGGAVRGVRAARSYFLSPTRARTQSYFFWVAGG